MTGHIFFLPSKRLSELGIGALLEGSLEYAATDVTTSTHQAAGNALGVTQPSQLVGQKASVAGKFTVIALCTCELPIVGPRCLCVCVHVLVWRVRVRPALS